MYRRWPLNFESLCLTGYEKPNSFSALADCLLPTVSREKMIRSLKDQFFVFSASQISKYLRI